LPIHSIYTYALAEHGAYTPTLELFPDHTSRRPPTIGVEHDAYIHSTLCPVPLREVNEAIDNLLASDSGHSNSLLTRGVLVCCDELYHAASPLGYRSVMLIHHLQEHRFSHQLH